MEEQQHQTDQNARCWECLRRRLVCDGCRPVCNKCRATRIVCPGYGDKKPLTWVATGRVTSRTRRQKKKSPGEGEQPPGTQSNHSGIRNSPGPLVIKEKPESNGSNGGYSDNRDNPAGSVDLDVEEITRLDWRAENSDAVQAVCYYNSAIYPQLLSDALSPSPFVVPLSALHYLPVAIRQTLVFMALGHRIQQTASEDGLCQEESRGQTSLARPMWSRLYHYRGLAIRGLNGYIAEAHSRCTDFSICSSVLFLFAELQLGLSPSWREHLKGTLTLVRLRGGARKLLASAPYMTGLLLNLMLFEVLGNTTTPASDQLIDISRPDHADLAAQVYSVGYYPAFPCPLPLFLDIIAVNNLRSRAATISSSTSSSPSPEDTAIVHQLLSSAAGDLLARIEAFSPAQWVRQEEELQQQQESAVTFHAEEWLLLARIYHAATALYCIASLQSLGLLLLLPVPQEGDDTTGHHPPDRVTTTTITATETAVRSRHRETLLSLLGATAEAVPRARRGITWPLVVAGFEVGVGIAGDRTPREGREREEERERGRALVRRALRDASRGWGTHLALEVGEVLERFWAAAGSGSGSGSGAFPSWDDCFDRPYIFVN